MFCLLYSAKQKNCINTKSHVIDIFTSEDMENISLCIFQYLTLYYIININIWASYAIEDIVDVNFVTCKLYITSVLFKVCYLYNLWLCYLR
jgi:hypothetical protein